MSHSTSKRIAEYTNNHPRASNAACARALGISKSNVEVCREVPLALEIMPDVNAFFASNPTATIVECARHLGVHGHTVKRALSRPPVIPVSPIHSCRKRAVETAPPSKVPPPHSKSIWRASSKHIRILSQQLERERGYSSREQRFTP